MTAHVLRMQLKPRHALRGRLILPNVETELRTEQTPPVEVYSAMRGPSGNGAPAPVLFGFGSVSQSTLIAMPVSGYITELLIDVEDAFDGAGAALSIGLGGDPNALMPDGYSALSIAQTYSASPMAFVAAGTPIIATYVAGAGASKGTARIYFAISPAPASATSVES